MAILKYKTKEDIPEDLREQAEQNKDGEGFIVNVAPKVKVEEFREKNQTLLNENARLKERVSTIESITGEDLDAFKDTLSVLKDTAQQVEDGKLKKSDAIEDELKRRTEQMRAAHEAKLRELQVENGNLKTVNATQSEQITQGKIAEYIRQQASGDDLGVDMAAMPYILADAFKEFVVEPSGRIVRKLNGEIQVGEDGISPQTGTEWLESRRKTTPFFFKASQGGGAQGGTGNSGSISTEEFRKMSPAQKLAYANSEAARKAK